MPISPHSQAERIILPWNAFQIGSVEVGCVEKVFWLATFFTATSVWGGSVERNLDDATRSDIILNVGYAQGVLMAVLWQTETERPRDAIERAIKGLDTVFNLVAGVDAEPLTEASFEHITQLVQRPICRGCGCECLDCRH